MRTLSDFIQLLESHGELVRVRARVSPILEIPAIADRLSKCPAPHAPSPSARATDPRFHHLGGPAVLFENVEGSDTPVLINAYGSYRRMELALGRSFQDVADQIGALVKPQPPRSLGEALALLRRLAPLRRIPPKRRRGPAAHHEVVLTGDQIDLTRLPLLRCWPLDGDLGAVGWPADINSGIAGVGEGDDWGQRFRGRYITLAGIHTIHADDRDDPKPASHNIGMYRVQLLGPQRLAMHWHMHHDGANHWRSWKKLGKPMPVAIVLGGEPILPYAATAPLPPGISELLMAGFLNGRGIELARARTVPLWIPANAEIVIEGFASHEAGHIGFEPDSRRTREHGTNPPLQPPLSGLRPEAGSENRPTPGPGAVIEGPFGDHTGFYSLPDRYPIVTVTAVTMRRKPVYPTTVVGLPPQEDYFLGKATERIFFPLLKTLIHDIEDYDLPMFGAFHNCAMVRIKKAYPLHARRVMHAIWGAGQMSWTKCIFVVDHDVDVHDTVAVLNAAARLCNPVRDLETVRGPLDILDHAAPYLGAGTKIGFDCTPKRDGEQAAHPHAHLDAHPEFAVREASAFTDAIGGIPGIRDARAIEACPGWFFVSSHVLGTEAEPAHHGRRLLADVHAKVRDLPGLHTPPFLVLLGPAVDLEAPGALDAAMFHWAANMDPGRDLFIAPVGGPGDPPRAIAMFDATPKSPHPGSHGGTAPGTAHHQPVRPWPPLLEYDPATRDLIDRRWDEYGLGGYKPVV